MGQLILAQPDAIMCTPFVRLLVRFFDALSLCPVPNDSHGRSTRRDAQTDCANVMRKMTLSGVRLYSLDVGRQLIGCAPKIGVGDVAGRRIDDGNSVRVSVT